MGLWGKMKTHKILQKGKYFSQTNLVYHIFREDTRGKIFFQFKGGCTFLAPARKVPKEAGQRGAEFCAPAQKDAPFGNPSRVLGIPVRRIDLKKETFRFKQWRRLRSRRPADFGARLHFIQKVGTLFV